jgi:hypothetical protein
MSDLKRILLRAAEIVEDNWTQGVEARNVEGEPVSAYASNAVSWCAIGAITKARSEVNADFPVSRSIDIEGLVDFNDGEAENSTQVAQRLRELADNV